MIGPVLIHEKKTQQTYSLFCGSLKAHEPGLNELLAFGTDDELALRNGFNSNFERSIHLLCEIHLKKNIENSFLSFGIRGKNKDEITFDIFGKHREGVFERGLSDANSEDDFFHKLGILEKRWSQQHTAGKNFYDWFLKQKAPESIRSVISPVRQRAGLGCLPTRFTTNRSERTSGVIQDFIQRECGQGKVNEYVFATTLQKSISMQEKDVEFSVVDKGKNKLRTSFEHIRVTSSRWSKMTENQMQAVLKKIHTISVQDVSLGSRLLSFNKYLVKQLFPLLKKLLDSGVDWIPRDLLAHMTKKASGLNAWAFPLPGTDRDTVVIPSKSKQNKPHIIVFQANGKCECPDCPGYSASSICAHVIAASVKINRLDAFLKWLVTTKRKTGGINYSKAIKFGMPSGRGRKPNQHPRKRSEAKHPSTDDLVIIPRITHDHHANSNAPQSSQLQSESRSNRYPVFQPTPRQELNVFSDQLQPSGAHGFIQASGPAQPYSRSVEYVQLPPAFTTPTPFTHFCCYAI